MGFEIFKAIFIYFNVLGSSDCHHISAVPEVIKNCWIFYESQSLRGAEADVIKLLNHQSPSILVDQKSLDNNTKFFSFSVHTQKNLECSIAIIRNKKIMINLLIKLDFSAVAIMSNEKLAFHNSDPTTEYLLKSSSAIIIFIEANVSLTLETWQVLKCVACPTTEVISLENFYSFQNLRKYWHKANSNLQERYLQMDAGPEDPILTIPEQCSLYKTRLLPTMFYCVRLVLKEKHNFTIWNDQSSKMVSKMKRSSLENNFTIKTKNSVIIIHGTLTANTEFVIFTTEVGHNFGGILKALPDVAWYSLVASIGAVSLVAATKPNNKLDKKNCYMWDYTRIAYLHFSVLLDQVLPTSYFQVVLVNELRII